MTDSCKQFNNLPCNQPEPFASLVDVITAAQILENAIHAPNSATTAAYLVNVSQNIKYAHDYVTSANLTELITRTTNIINYINQTLIPQANATNSSTLSTFQKNTLYGFQGVLSRLYYDLNALVTTNMVSYVTPTTTSNMSPINNNIPYGTLQHAQPSGNNAEHQRINQFVTLRGFLNQ